MTVFKVYYKKIKTLYYNKIEQSLISPNMLGNASAKNMERHFCKFQTSMQCRLVSDMITYFLASLLAVS